VSVKLELTAREADWLQSQLNHMVATWSGPERNKAWEMERKVAKAIAETPAPGIERETIFD